MECGRLIPFLWIRNEDETKIYREIQAIKDMGTNYFMIESRPARGLVKNSDFASQAWFDRVEKILEFAKKLEMKVWLLDDATFPTGYANDGIKYKYQHLEAKQIKCDILDVVLNGEPYTCFRPISADASYDKLLYACIEDENGNITALDSKDEKSFVLPALKGVFRVYFIVLTNTCPEIPWHIDMLSKESANVMIKEVYSPHYEKFKDYFGNVFIGFFSDEPRFSDGDNYRYSAGKYGELYHMDEHEVGHIGLAYAYSLEIDEMLQKQGFTRKDLLSLFTDVLKNYSDLRIAYMQAITDAYNENFVGQLSTWCHERGVVYAGHVVEDTGIHLKTGVGAGHYFKAMRGADFAGIDVVGHQIRPCLWEKPYLAGAVGFRFHNDMNHFTLAKLASSFAVQDERADGKSICELFGAYGWGEDIKTMLYLVNHMAVRGINRFIPHAFSMNVMDPDSPPFFYGEGKNPAIGGYKKLFEYMNYLSEFNRRSYARVAIYYNADSAWAGRKYMPMDTVSKYLTENHIEFDFIDDENLKKADISEGKIKIHTSCYNMLVIPEGYLSNRTKALLDMIKIEKYVANEENLNELSRIIEKYAKQDYKLYSSSKHLRIKRICENGYMLFNESLFEIEFNLETSNKSLYLVDVISKQIISSSLNGKIEGVIKSQQALFVFEICPQDCNYIKQHQTIENVKTFDVTKFAFGGEVQSVGEKTVDYSIIEDDIDFSGSIEYSFKRRFTNEESLMIDFYGQYLKVEINGVAQDYILSPVILNVGEGSKKVKLTVCNTLANVLKDETSTYAEVSSCGLKKVTIIK